ncbi:hypothetical protein KF913_13440 [Candidatus Obscuribacterales bacterium]|nr:hypothetical protein [Candidatus Obscuribacterales bacterium]
MSISSLRQMYKTVLVIVSGEGSFRVLRFRAGPQAVSNSTTSSVTLHHVSMAVERALQYKPKLRAAMPYIEARILSAQPTYRQH